MKVGFWNINNKDKNKGAPLELISDFAQLNGIDFLILFESNYQPAEILLNLNAKQSLFSYYLSNISDFIQIFTTFPTDFLRDVSDEYRLSAKEYSTPLNNKINFVFLHLPSKLFYEEADQDAHTFKVKKFIDDIEMNTNHENTIVLGDFNMNPFQKGMIQSTGLHSTFDRKIALKQSRTINNTSYKFFYNPMWSFYGEKGKGEINGTYYKNTAKPICYFWNIFDQVLLRPNLINYIFNETSLKIVTSIGNKSLLTRNGEINLAISDHLPVEFELNV